MVVGGWLVGGWWLVWVGGWWLVGRVGLVVRAFVGRFVGGWSELVGWLVM